MQQTSLIGRNVHLDTERKRKKRIKRTLKKMKKKTNPLNQTQKEEKKQVEEETREIIENDLHEKIWKKKIEHLTTNSPKSTHSLYLKNKNKKLSPKTVKKWRDQKLLQGNLHKRTH